MIRIPIYIRDSVKAKAALKETEQRENLGLEYKRIPIPQVLVDMWIDETKISGFWVDPDIDDDTQARDIVFYLVVADGFRTPWTEEMESLLKSILNPLTYFNKE